MPSNLPALLAAAALLLRSAAGHATEPLPALGVDESQTSVSGISSGAYMAGQFHLAFSTTVVGAGVVAGGPWGCASNGSGDALLLGGFDNAARALTGCMQVTGGAPDGGELAKAAAAFAHKHRIDSLAGPARRPRLSVPWRERQRGCYPGRSRCRGILPLRRHPC